jgi:hypothetical protein
VLKAMLEGGANPLLLDASGHSPLEVAQLPTPAWQQQRHPGAAPKEQIVALLKQHLDK